MLLAVVSPALDLLARRAAAPLARSAEGTEIRLAIAAVAAGRRRASWGAGAVGVAVALAVAIGTMVHSFRATVIDWANQGLRADVWIRPLAATTGVQVGRLDPEVVRVAERLFGTEAIDPFHTAAATMAAQPVTLAGGEFAVVARRGGVAFRDGRDSRVVFAAALAHRAAVVGEPFATRFGVREGDTITLRVADGTLSRKVEGVFYDYSNQQGMVVIDRHDFLRHVPDDGPRELALFLPAGVDPAAARDRLLAALGGRFLIDALLNRELRAEVVAIFDRTFAITRALQAVAAAVAVLAVLTVLFALLGERRRGPRAPARPRGHAPPGRRGRGGAGRASRGGRGCRRARDRPRDRVRPREGRQRPVVRMDAAVHAPVAFARGHGDARHRGLPARGARSRDRRRPDAPRRGAAGGGVGCSGRCDSWPLRRFWPPQAGRRWSPLLPPCNSLAITGRTPRSAPSGGT